MLTTEGFILKRSSRKTDKGERESFRVKMENINRQINCKDNSKIDIEINNDIILIDQIDQHRYQ